MATSLLQELNWDGSGHVNLEVKDNSAVEREGAWVEQGV
jgi:hypothetical protein